MSTTTTNLGLTKPAGGDTVDIDDINGNMDILDTAIGDVDVSQDGDLQSQIDALGESVPKYNSYTATTDTAGRILINVPINKLLSVTVNNTTAYAMPRHVVNDGVNQTLIYIRNIDTNAAVSSTSQTVYYWYMA